MNKNKYFLTLDLEDWSNLEYLKKYDNIKSSISYISAVNHFLDILEKKDIYISVFVVGEIAIKNKELIKSIRNRGHEIGSHTKIHDLQYNLSDSDFISSNIENKKILEDIIGEEIIGFRAPCFSMNNTKLDLLFNECGFKYDSSFINTKHPLYGNIDMSSYNKIESLIYERNGNYVFEIPTLEMLGKSLPISGGGYFRMFPLSLTKYFYKLYTKNSSNFLFYIHPFELSSDKLDVYNQFSVKDKFRFQVGRNNNIDKFQKYLDFILKLNFEFQTFEHYIKKKENK